MIISACAGASTSEVSHFTSSSGSRRSAPMIARSSSSMEPMASAPSAIAGCTPMAKATGSGRPIDSAMRWNSHRCLPSVRWIDVRSRPWIIRRL
jgi:hypothetical protein